MHKQAHAVSGNKRLRVLVIVFPATKNACSDATLVTWIVRKSCAISLIIGNLLEWAYHHKSGSISSSIRNSRYRSNSDDSTVEDELSSWLDISVQLASRQSFAKY